MNVARIIDLQRLCNTHTIFFFIAVHIRIRDVGRMLNTSHAVSIVPVCMLRGCLGFRQFRHRQTRCFFGQSDFSTNARDGCDW